MLHAFVSRGLELRLQEMKYHAQGQDNAVESLTGISSKDSDAEAGHNPSSVLRRKSACTGANVWSDYIEADLSTLHLV